MAFYQMIGASKGACKDTITSAYQETVQLSMQRNVPRSDTEVTNAWQAFCVLNNDAYREQYDSYLDADGADDCEIFHKFAVDEEMPSFVQPGEKESSDDGMNTGKNAEEAQMLIIKELSAKIVQLEKRIVELEFQPLVTSTPI